MIHARRFGLAVQRALTFVLLTGGFLVAAPHAEAAQPCQFVLGFQALHDAAANDIGDCLESANYQANGDAFQHTTKGLLVWLKSSNLTQFTNGFRTWIIGPAGLVSRLNSDHFSWEGPTSSVASATISCCPDPASVALTLSDQDVPPNYVVSDEGPEPGGGYSRTLRSYYNPDQAITTVVMPEPSKDAALAELTTVGSRYPTSNKVLGQAGAGFQNDGTAGVGDESTLIESRARLIILWTKNNYLMELDDSTGDGYGLAIVRARVMESRLERLLGISTS